MGTAALDTLHEAIDALGGLDLDALTDAELDELTIGLQRERHRLAALTATSLARWESRGVWLSDGSRSSSARFARDGRTSQSTARTDLRRARALVDMPATRDAVTLGDLSMDHVDLLAAADSAARHECFARDEAMLVEHCRSLRFVQAQKVVDYWKLRVDAAGCEADAAAQEEAASVHASRTLDGTVRLDGLLDRLGGAIVLDELNRLEREQYLADQAAGITRTAGQRCAAALVEMAARSASTPAGAQRPRALITVLVGDTRFAELCELANGTVVSPGQIVPHLGASDLETILFGDDLAVLGASSQRTFSGRLRRAIQVRDRHCQHPSGCDVPAPDCDVDHVVPHSLGGPTTQWHGRLECRPHNRDSTKHDHDARPRPPREITERDIRRARRRWRRQRGSPVWEVWRLEHVRMPDDHDDPGADRPGRTDAA